MKTRGRKPRVISFVFVFGTWNTRKGDKIGVVLQISLCVPRTRVNKAKQALTSAGYEAKKPSMNSEFMVCGRLG
jgi:hypothetical protein